MAQCFDWAFSLHRPPTSSRPSPSAPRTRVYSCLMGMFVVGEVIAEVSWDLVGSQMPCCQQAWRHSLALVRDSHYFPAHVLYIHCASVVSLQSSWLLVDGRPV